MTFQVTSIEGSNGIGCEVHGLTFDALSDDGARKALFDTWIEHGVIVFRGVEGAEFQIALSRVFGEVQPHPHANRNPDRPVSDLVQISYDPENADIYKVDGKVLGGWLPWHMDLVYADKISRGSILRPVVRPYEGGRTGFVDKIKLYDKLSSEMRERIEGLYVMYHFDMDLANLRYARPRELEVVSLSKLYSSLIQQRDQFPKVKHPLVYKQAETGRSVLNFSPYFAQGIIGLSREESDAILGPIGEMCQDPANHYYHEWRPDDMVLWDNWRMLHSASGVPTDASRVMERSQIMGDYGLGRIEHDTREVAEEITITV